VLADAIGVLLERPDMADAMGRAGRRHARARFSWTRTVDEYDARYRQVTEETAHDRTGRTLAAE
jgi:glycosyltransferase involved in cell wall biosynthesis